VLHAIDRQWWICLSANAMALACVLTDERKRGRFRVFLAEADRLWRLCPAAARGCARD